MEALPIILAFVVIALAIRLLAGLLDGDRTREYIRSQEGEVLALRWSPFGRGWLGEKNARIYEVQYRDQEGNIHEATVKTSMLAGVYFTEDRIVQLASTDPREHSESLQEQNALLRRRIAELEREANR